MAQWQEPYKQKEKSPEPTSKLGTGVSVCNPSMLLGRLESDASMEAQKLGICRGRMRDQAHAHCSMTAPPRIDCQEKRTENISNSL